VKLTNSSQNGYLLMQAGAIFGFWGDQRKFDLSTSTGMMTLYGLNGVRAFQLDANGAAAHMYDSNGDEKIKFEANDRRIHMYDSNGQRKIFLDADTGTVWADVFAHNY